MGSRDVAMKRTTIVLPDKLHRKLWREALCSSTSHKRLQSPAAPRPSKSGLLNVIGIYDGPIRLAENIDENLYGE